jgi:hypothetical protein
MFPNRWPKTAKQTKITISVISDRLLGMGHSHPPHPLRFNPPRLFSVAQISNLPYRRFPIGRASYSPNAGEHSQGSHAGSPVI